MPTFIDWQRVDPLNPPQPTAANTAFLFCFDGDVYTGWPLVDPAEDFDERDDDGYPIWETSEGPQSFGGVRWYAETFNRPPKRKGE